MKGSEAIRPLNHESVLKLLQTNAQSILSMFDEPMSIMFVVVWRPELGPDLPFGGITTRQGESTPPSLLLSCLRQITKLAHYIVAALDPSARIKELEDKIRQQEIALNEQTEQIRRLQDKSHDEKAPH